MEGRALPERARWLGSIKVNTSAAQVAGMREGCRGSDAADAFTLKRFQTPLSLCHYIMFSRREEDGGGGGKGGLKDAPSSRTLSRRKLHFAVFYLERRPWLGVSGEQRECLQAPVHLRWPCNLPNILPVQEIQ